MTSAGGDSVVGDLLIVVAPIVCGVLCCMGPCYVVPVVLSSFAIILSKKGELVILL